MAYSKTTWTNGVTPINETNLNKIENGLEMIEQEDVIVSSTEPVSDRRKVWIQKGKNLFNKNKGITNAWLTNNGEISLFENDNIVSDFISCKPNTSYVASGYSSNVYLKVCGYNKNKTYTQIIVDVNSQETSKSFTTGNNDYYIRVGYGYGNLTLNTLQLEQNTTATTYEAYIDKKIYIKNDNDVYEEFYDEVYSTEIITNANGTAIKYSDGTLICSGTISVTPTWDQWGSLYAGALTNLNKTFPVNFVSTPVINGTVTQGTNGGTGMISWITSSTTAIDNINIIRPTTYSGPIFINYIAIGKWK